MGKRFLVTGGAGFIGSHVVTQLINQGHWVRVLDNLSEGNLENFEPVSESVDFHYGNVLDPEACERAMESIEYVIHLAAQISVPLSLQFPEQTNRTNIEGTVNLLKSALLNKISGFCFASSAAVYGNTEVLPIKESAEKQPLSPYAISKLTGENYCTLYRELYHLPTASFRFFNVFGPRQKINSSYASVIPRFIDKIRRQECPVVYGNGEQSRDFVYVEDVARILISGCLNASRLDQPYNLCTGKRITLNEVLTELQKLHGEVLMAKYLPHRAGDIIHSQGDNTSLKAVLSDLGEKTEFMEFASALKITFHSYMNSNLGIFSEVVPLRNRLQSSF
jgi:nucleoside-diphosphate-sugar epimerase